MPSLIPPQVFALQEAVKKCTSSGKLAYINVTSCFQSVPYELACHCVIMSKAIDLDDEGPIILTFTPPNSKTYTLEVKREDVETTGQLRDRVVTNVFAIYEL